MLKLQGEVIQDYKKLVVRRDSDGALVRLKHFIDPICNLTAY